MSREYRDAVPVYVIWRNVKAQREKIFNGSYERGDKMSAAAADESASAMKENFEGRTCFCGVRGKLIPLYEDPESTASQAATPKGPARDKIIRIKRDYPRWTMRKPELLDIQTQFLLSPVYALLSPFARERRDSSEARSILHARCPVNSATI